MSKQQQEVENFKAEIRDVEAHSEFKAKYLTPHYDYMAIKTKVIDALEGGEYDYNEVWRDVNYLKSFVGESTT